MIHLQNRVILSKLSVISKERIYNTLLSFRLQNYFTDSETVSTKRQLKVEPGID